MPTGTDAEKVTQQKAIDANLAQVMKLAKVDSVKVEGKK